MNTHIFQFINSVEEDWVKRRIIRLQSVQACKQIETDIQRWLLSQFKNVFETTLKSTAGNSLDK